MSLEKCLNTERNIEHESVQFFVLVFCFFIPLFCAAFVIFFSLVCILFKIQIVKKKNKRIYTRSNAQSIAIQRKRKRCATLRPIILLKSFLANRNSNLHTPDTKCSARYNVYTAFGRTFKIYYIVFFFDSFYVFTLEINCAFETWNCVYLKRLWSLVFCYTFI